ncbi:hypothetical protein DPEC_G00342370 [Dallia pectoralis]|uniref:Uncharacterized protein n=1 Tax=Dallia pectoralis TaxID=75939 RepID=A0ACC2F5Q0_DALPE|nr:hypothetical protein DPEC_G00342370 [Dallia pectoralis]
MHQNKNSPYAALRTSVPVPVTRALVVAPSHFSSSFCLGSGACLPFFLGVGCSICSSATSCSTCGASNNHNATSLFPGPEFPLSLVPPAPPDPAHRPTLGPEPPSAQVPYPAPGV